MATVDVNGSSLQVDSQPKSLGLFLGWRPLDVGALSAFIEMNRVNFRNGLKAL